MEKKVIVGIDVSKSWLDAHVLFTGNQEDRALRISNTNAGFSKLIKWISKSTDVESCKWLFCMEHTGTYSYGLNACLQEKNISQSMVNALAIKRSMGIIRGKNDKADARVIAQYAMRFQDSLQEFRLPAESLQRLKIQLSQRERMVDLKRQTDLAMESMEALPHEQSPQRVKVLLLDFPSDSFERVEMTDEVMKLADKYITEKVVGRTSLEDCRHIALATINKVDALASWNFKHIVNLNRIKGYNSVNLKFGYGQIEIRTPQELVNYGD